MSGSPAYIADQSAEEPGPVTLQNGSHASTAHTANPPDNRAWWKETQVYQIYPSSFCDSNGDGIGDIPGITSKLDYLQELDVESVWLCPFNKSPQVDNGYDISDYRDVDPQYGTLEDVQTLIDEAHKRNMRFIMDLVVNHTSDQHEWFKQSRSSKDSPYRNWYHWHPGKVVNGVRCPPNNWCSYFSGSAWEWDEQTQEYYLHIFAKEQPDLNWENPKVVEEVHDILHFWLKRGVDGFRMDVINFISKVPGYPDAKVTKQTAFTQYHDGSEHFANGPRLHEFLKGLGAILKQYNAFSVGEMPCVKDANEILKAVGYSREELCMIFHFEIVDMDHGKGGKFSHRDFSLKELKQITHKWQTFMYENSGWNALYLENHDQSRTVSRFTSDAPEHRVPAAKMLATYMTFQAGTPFLYEGQELGMVNVPKEWDMDKYRDLETLNHWKEVSEHYRDQPETLAAYRTEYQKKGRDNARTPMPWNSISPNAGFTRPDVTPWIELNPSYKTINAEAQTSDPNSPFSYWKKALKTRKDFIDVFVYGSFELVDGTMEDDEVLAYRRTYHKEEAVVICNWSTKSITRTKKQLGLEGTGWEILLDTAGSLKGSSDAETNLSPFQAAVYHRRG